MRWEIQILNQIYFQVLSCSESISNDKIAYDRIFPDHDILMTCEQEKLLKHRKRLLKPTRRSCFVCYKKNFYKQET